MWKILLDEDMPRSLAKYLRQAGHDVTDVRDVGLRGHSDAEVFAYAQAERAILITADKGFANVLKHPPGSHAGIVVSRVPDTLPTDVVNQAIVQALAKLEGENLAGMLVIIERERIRLRRPDNPDIGEEASYTQE
jgi:predicted nuclease of predicted toxin-antitoxin system